MSYQISGDCKLCGICQKVCPVGAIIIKDKAYVIDGEKCKSCGACAAECPRAAIAFLGETADFESRYVTAKPSFYGRGGGRHIHRAGKTWAPIG